MHMDIAYLESVLAQGIVSSSVHFQDIGDIDNIVIVSQQFLCGPSPLPPRCLYICDVKRLAPLMKLRQGDERITVLTVGYSKNHEQFKNDQNLNILATSTESDVQNAAKLIDLSLPASYACVAVRFSASSLKRIPVNYLISRFREIFPGGLVACYEEHILVLAPFPRKKTSISYDCEALQKLLIHFHGYAGISYRSQYYVALPEMFEESLITIRLGMAMDPHASCPIFEFHDYHIYQLLDLCNKSITAAGKQRSMTHLCSPRFLNLLRLTEKTTRI